MMEQNKKEKDWFDSPNIVTYVIIGLLIILILASQSFAIQNRLSFGEIFRSIINHNAIYFITLIYFVLLRFKIGKKYFDYLNVLMAILYLLLSFASVFTIFQSFGLASLLNLALTVVLTLYFIYAFICNTVIGKELKISNTPLNEIKNQQYFSIICVLLALILVVDLIAATDFEGVVISLLEVMYQVLFARYIYLYKEYSDTKAKRRKESLKQEELVEEKEEPVMEKEEKTNVEEAPKEEKTEKITEVKIEVEETKVEEGKQEEEKEEPKKPRTRKKKEEDKGDEVK